MKLPPADAGIKTGGICWISGPHQCGNTWNDIIEIFQSLCWLIWTLGMCWGCWWIHGKALSTLSKVLCLKCPTCQQKAKKSLMTDGNPEATTCDLNMRLKQWETLCHTTKMTLLITGMSLLITIIALTQIAIMSEVPFFSWENNHWFHVHT